MRVNTHRKQAPRRKSFGNTLIGLFVGLVIGVLAAAGVVWYVFKTPAPLSSKYQATVNAPATAQPAIPAGTVPAPMALPGKPNRRSASA